MFRVGIIGAGDFAAAHAQALRALSGRAVVVGAAEPNRERGTAFCEKHGIPALYPSAGELLAATKPEVVHICTPPATHAPLALECLNAGAHVLCEKPLCASLAVFDELRAAEAAAGRTLSTMFQWRFGAAAQHIHRLTAEGAFGELRAAVCHTLWYRGSDYYAVPWRGRWEDALGGTIMGHGIHLIDLMLWLLPAWRDVYAHLATLDYAVDVDTLAAALVRFEGGAIASVMSSAVSPRQETYLRLDFQRATVEVRALYEYDSDDWTITPRDPADAERWSIPARGRNSIGAQISALLDSLERGDAPLVTGPEARRILDFMTALHKSAYTRQAVARASVGPDDPYYRSLRG